MIYVALIQTMLFFLAVVMLLCELTPRFSNAILVQISRAVIAVSLLVLSYYSQYLIDAPTPLLLATLFASVGLTVLLSKYILAEYLKRVNKIKRKRINEQ